MMEAKKDGVVKVIGLMSGTSLDGVDAAVLETDGEGVVLPGPAMTYPFEPGLRGRLRSALEEAASAQVSAKISNTMRETELELTSAHADAVRSLLGESGLGPEEISYLGFHGQTILHRPRESRTWQLGDGAMLADETGIRVVNDFRQADISSGGQGAPFAPLYHQALAQSANALLPMVVLNIGGVSNVTYIGPEGMLLAFDTGPGNAPIDDWMMKHLGEPMDRDGALAEKGVVNQQAVMQMLSHPYFSLPPPKSLDRFDFTSELVADLSSEDAVATLSAFTVLSIVRGTEHFPERERGWLVAGGGRHNIAMMESLRGVLRAPILPVEKAGWRGDFMEAEAFAYLALRCAKGLPLSLPSTTGVAEPKSGGRIHLPAHLAR